MALEVYFAEDIRRIIAAGLIAALSAAQASDAPNVEFCRGVVCQARSQAAAFGISWGAVREAMREAFPERLTDDLWLLTEGERL